MCNSRAMTVIDLNCTITLTTYNALLEDYMDYLIESLVEVRDIFIPNEFHSSLVVQ